MGPTRCRRMGAGRSSVPYRIIGLPEARLEVCSSTRGSGGLGIFTHVELDQGLPLHQVADRLLERKEMRRAQVVIEGGAVGVDLIERHAGWVALPRGEDIEAIAARLISNRGFRILRQVVHEL